MKERLSTLHSREKPMDNISLIFLVEDNPDDELLTRRAIISSGLPIRVESAVDGPQALEILLGAAAPQGSARLTPDLIFLDLKLPRLNGLEVLSILRGRAETRLLPIIILTSSAEKSDVYHAYERGCNSYIQKPVGFERFAQSIHAACHYWLRLNQMPGQNKGTTL